MIQTKVYCLAKVLKIYISVDFSHHNLHCHLKYFVIDKNLELYISFVILLGLKFDSFLEIGM